MIENVIKSIKIENNLESIFDSNSNFPALTYPNGGELVIEFDACDLSVVNILKNAIDIIETRCVKK